MHIGFVSTRFAGTDGVSLESAKWAEVLWRDNHVSHWYSGRSDRNPAVSCCVPEAHFGHPEVRWINDQIWGKTTRSRHVTSRIWEMAVYLKSTLYDFVEKFGIELLIPENALTIPMNIPLGIALTEFLSETGKPAILHHHDFYWERTRFAIHSVGEILDMAFPPDLPHIMHTVINRSAQQQLSYRKGVSSLVTPNVHDFDQNPRGADAYSRDVREEFGIAPDDIFILQPTRVVPRKGIENAIKLVGMLNDPRCKLVISHEAGDEGVEYKYMLEDLAREEEVEVLFVSDRVSEVRQFDAEGRKMYTLWDLYPHADLVTYPSTYEGFGNALLESIYFKVPIVLNRYSIFVEDIEPKEFKLVLIDGFVTRKTAEEVRKILSDPDHREEMVEHNFQVARKYYGFNVLQNSLRMLLGALTGWTPNGKH